MAEDDDALPELAKLLRRFRRRLEPNVSQSDLADRTRPGDVTTQRIVSASTIGMIEKGKRGASPRVIDALAMALELNEDEHAQLRRAAGHDDEGAIGALGIVRRLDTLEEAFEAVNRRLDDLENHLDDLDRRLP